MRWQEPNPAGPHRTQRNGVPFRSNMITFWHVCIFWEAEQGERRGEEMKTLQEPRLKMMKARRGDDSDVLEGDP